MTEMPADRPDSLDPEGESAVEIPDATGMPMRPDLTAAARPGAKDEPYTEEENVYDPREDMGLIAGEGTES